ncbi:DUF1836 domain-containing protein [Oceanobacillus chungangensis]|uniref:DUF1836 domain-containing protein n=1 Tax=Oceanobacillus chungangensis TaxID=1229152 RepID=A0A3D8Q1L2_9BACI|nr:DUF1836 domain-containing protein [Oceanobacillus chungangensis]RDW20905.1 hypothetical protein CWR45_03385 [Oceanobacillus chungangensis]
MENINELMKELHLDTTLSLKDIPEINLYMDQVIQLFENKFAPTKRNDDEKILTKTMVNNYAKGKLFFPIKNKKYTKEHIMLISMIYQMKSALSINDIKKSLQTLNEKILEEEEFNIEKLYDRYLILAENNVARFLDDSMALNQEIFPDIAEQENIDAEYFQQLLLVASFANMSNLYRRAAEKIIDGMKEPQAKRD